MTVRAAHRLEDVDDSVDVNEAARLLGCDPSTVRKLLSGRRLKGHRVGVGNNPRGIRVSVASVVAYKRRHAIGGETPEPSAEPPTRQRAPSAAVREMRAELRKLGLSV
jgi:excisionase family DNA binding protein